MLYWFQQLGQGGNQAVREEAYQAELLGIEKLLYAEMDWFVWKSLKMG